MFVVSTETCARVLVCCHCRCSRAARVIFKQNRQQYGPSLVCGLFIKKKVDLDKNMEQENQGHSVSPTEKVKEFKLEPDQELRFEVENDEQVRNTAILNKKSF